MQERKHKICFIVAADMTLKFILLSQMKFFLDNGYDVYAVSSPGRWTKEIENTGAKFKNIKIKRKISPFYDLISLFRLYRHFKKENFGAVFTFTPKPGLLGQLGARLAGVPIVINTIFGFYFHESTSYLRRRFFISIEKIAAKFSDAILFRNKEDFKTAAKEGIGNAEKNKFFGDGIDILRFDPEKFSDEFLKRKKEEFKIPQDAVVLGIVARLVKEKGYLELFSAFEKVILKFPDARLLIIGQADLQKKDSINPVIVKDYGIEKNVLFLGERTDVDEIFALMDIFVLPSYREGLPHSVMEASSMAKPVVATDIRGCRQAVDNGRTGFLVPVKNPEKLAEAIIYLLENQNLSKKMGQAGRKKAEKEFDERLVFDRIKKEYERLILKKNI